MNSVQCYTTRELNCGNRLTDSFRWNVDFLKQIYLNNSSHCLTKLNTSAVLKSCAVHTWGTRKNKKYFITNMTFHHITLHTINNASFESVNHGIMEWHYKLLWTKRIMGQKRLGTTHIHQKPSMRVHTWS